MLEEVGRPYRTEVVDYGAAMRDPSYLALNPMAKVPTLVCGNDVVTECAAICTWLAETYPEAGLAPKPEERARYYRWMFFAAGPLDAKRVGGLESGAEHVHVERARESTITGDGQHERVLDLGPLVEQREPLQRPALACGLRHEPLHRFGVRPQRLDLFLRTTEPG